MTTKIAINGFGRIGRLVMRALLEQDRSDIELVAINNPAPAETSAHLFKYDSVHGTFHGDVEATETSMTVNGKTYRCFAERDPAKIDWADAGVDVVLECTGKFNDGEKAKAHFEGGAKKVLISAPAKNVNLTVVYGVNDDKLEAGHTMVSNASCTTNCLAPVAKVLHDAIGIKQGLMTTVHAYTNDQTTLDRNHKDLRRARAAAMSLIPTSTGAAKAVGLVLPELNGKLDGFAIRVPTPNVSLVDLSFTAAKPTSADDVNALMTDASKSNMKGIIDVNKAPLVSIDFNHNPASAVFDATQTRVSSDGTLVKVLAWYDNEWGFSNRMLDTLSAMGRA